MYYCFVAPQLGFFPCSVTHSSGGDHVLLAGSNRQVNLCTRDGTRLQTVCTPKKGWIWAAKAWGRAQVLSGASGGGMCVAVGCDDGSIDMYRLQVC